MPIEQKQENGLIFPSVWKVSSVESINKHYLTDETECVQSLLTLAELDEQARFRVRSRAEKLVTAVRENRTKKGGLDAFLQKYDLSSKEGTILMCLAEALLRIPDADTADALIKDKLGDANWKEHLGTTDSLFVNASTWGLMLTGRLVTDSPEQDIGAFLKRLVARAGEPVVRGALRQAMKIMGHQYVMGATIDEATKRAEKKENRQYRYSYDMLGEAALTSRDAQGYFESYARAIDRLGIAAAKKSVFSAPSISVKLSALHPRYEFAQRSRVLIELAPSLLELALRAKSNGVALTVDAEEADRLELSLELFQSVFEDEQLREWNGLGLAVQAYQKRALSVVEWLIDLAEGAQKKIPVRLVKGAYWDTEIKLGQVNGLVGYPLFTRKTSTDVSYLACARRLLGAQDWIYPQFATHNARTLAAILEMAGDSTGYEFQRLHGMGEELYAEVVGDDKLNRACRVYAPVGDHKDLLPYLVRRLLENGANTSFVNRISDESVPVAEIIEDPVILTQRLKQIPHPAIPLPQAIYGPTRRNSHGLNMFDTRELRALATELEQALSMQWKATPLVDGETRPGASSKSVDPADQTRIVGDIIQANEQTVDEAIASAAKNQTVWDATPAHIRGGILRKAADLYETNRGELLALCIREAGKTLDDAAAELREAVDFLRYYAAQAEADFGPPRLMPGPTGESNQLSLHGRGVFVCISPWNFPLAIFTGQVAAALAAGNTVVAKPAEQTSLIAYQAVKLLQQAGVPGSVLHFLPGPGRVIGSRAVADSRIAGVAFTGSTETAKLINRSLADRPGAIATLIAETGGQNAMIVDSSALPEQVVIDVIQSAFKSAGQRCSALRILCLQKEIAPRILALLKGSMDELVVGDPGLLATDIGPVIDSEARDNLNQHVSEIQSVAKLVHQVKSNAACELGSFVLPAVIEINDISVLDREVFGPVLHVIQFKSNELDKLLDQINDTGFGLTLGIHSRVNDWVEYVYQKVKVGNAYVNRNMVGAVVGTQPFGGCNLSGTGPKAGGPHYLYRYATERTVTINTAAVGGNTSLLSLDQSDPVD